MTPEEIAKAVMSKWYAGPTLAKHVDLVAPAIRAALRERDAAWAAAVQKADLDCGRVNVAANEPCCAGCAPLRALLEEAGK